MDLHHAGGRPEWQSIPPENQNVWQRIAAQTHGVVTVANILSVGGFLSVTYGLLLIAQGQWAVGLAYTTLGRLADIFDGYVASWTGTKSPIGAAIDAGLDKLIILVALIVLLATGILPWIFVLLIALLNIANATISIYGKSHGARIQPSQSGKLSAFMAWTGMGFFAVAHLTSGVVLLAALPLAYGLTIVGLIMGYAAAVGYYQLATKLLTLPINPQFDRYLVIRNPVSTEARRAEARIAELRRLHPNGEHITVATVGEGRAANAHILHKYADKLGPRTLLCIAAGDGTVNIILNTLLNDPALPKAARQTPILPLWCGNANDLAYMLNGSWSRHKLRQILTSGKVVAIRPLDCTLSYADGKSEQNTAACYCSFGATAFVAEEVERSVPRNSPLRKFIISRAGKEIYATLRALILSPMFVIAHRDRVQAIYERTYFNGSRYAGFIGIAQRLTDEKFHRITLEHKHPFELLFQVIGLMNGKEIAKRALARDLFTIHEATWGQFDGDAIHIPRNTTVKINLAKHPFYAISTRLPG